MNTKCWLGLTAALAINIDTTKPVCNKITQVFCLTANTQLLPRHIKVWKAEVCVPFSSADISKTLFLHYISCRIQVNHSLHSAAAGKQHCLETGWPDHRHT